MAAGTPEDDGSRSPSEGEALLRAVEFFCAATPDVVFAYLFGSRARGDHAPDSDVDLAVWLAPQEAPFQRRLVLMEQLCCLLRRDDVDLVDLASAPPVLRHEVISDGRVIKESREERVEFEVRTLREYLDTAYLRRVQNEAMMERFRAHGRSDGTV